MTKEQLLQYIGPLQSQALRGSDVFLPSRGRNRISNYAGQSSGSARHSSWPGRISRAVCGPALALPRSSRGSNHHTRRQYDRRRKYTEFHFFKDYSNFSGRNMKAGDIYITTNWCIYSLKNERFKHIRVAHFRLHDPNTARL